MDRLPKIEKKNISDQVFDILKEYIVKGQFKPGDKIPSENELCSMLGVSRPSVNAAVNRLRAMGLVEVRVGDGSYVRYFSTNEYIENYADFITDTQNLSEILEVRRAVEFESAALAVARATDQDLDELKDLCDKLVEAKKQRDYEAAVTYDFEFHLRICHCSKNRYFPMIYKLIGSLIYKQIELFATTIYKREEEAGLDVVDDHVQLYHALRDRDVDLCRKILLEQTDYAAHMD